MSQFKYIDPSPGDATHKWADVPGRDWQCCRLCGIIRRVDRQNSPCKGETKMRELERVGGLIK